MRCVVLLLSSSVVVAISPARALAQTDYSRLKGTWVMDTTNGPDDHGLPKSETLVFAPTANGFRLTSTEDDGQGPQTSNFDCTAAGAQTTSGSSTVQCTVHPMRDSVGYAVDVRQNGKVVATERGRLIVASSGRTMRDEYDASDGGKPATHHRHIYSKHS
jgi:hypothetical protein